MITNKYLWILLAVLASGALGFWYGRGDKQIEIREVVKQGETKTVVVERVVTVTKTVKPDGTVTETTSTAEKQKNQTQETSESSNESSSTPVATQWGIGGGARASLSTLGSPSYYLTGAYRVLGPFWVEAGAATDKTIQLGVRVEL